MDSGDVCELSFTMGNSPLDSLIYKEIYVSAKSTISLAT